MANHLYHPQSFGIFNFLFLYKQKKKKKSKKKTKKHMNYYLKPLFILMRLLEIIMTDD